MSPEETGMDWIPAEDAIRKRIEAMCARVEAVHQGGVYFYNMPVTELRGGARVVVNGREMKMFPPVHPQFDQPSASTRQPRTPSIATARCRRAHLAGSLTLQAGDDLRFKGPTTPSPSRQLRHQLTTVSTLVGRHDTVFCDKLNHASIVDGCILSGAKFERFRHNDMNDLEARLQEAPSTGARLVVVDAVFSMDGDIVDLPHVVELCRRYHAWLMIDEAHSLGVLGETGRGIEEHFRMPGVIDIKMGTLSKTIPSVGGYIAGAADLVTYLRHQSRAYIFSAALPPAQAAAALEAFRVIEDEPWRVQAVQRNAAHFIESVRSHGLDTLHTETAIVPVLCGTDDRAFRMTSEAHKRDIFVLPVVSPAVPEGLARLRATVTAAHQPEEIEAASTVFAEAGHKVGIL
jgi:glycine C-acetyltransferase